MRAGAVPARRAPRGGSVQDQRAPQTEAARWVGADRPATETAARRRAVDRRENPPREPRDGAGDRASRGWRALSDHHAPSGGGDAPGRRAGRNPGSGSPGRDAGALAVTRAESSACGRRSPQRVHPRRAASRPCSRRTPGAGTFRRERARRLRRPIGPPDPGPPALRRRREPPLGSARPARQDRVCDGAPSRRAGPARPPAAGRSWDRPQRGSVCGSSRGPLRAPATAARVPIHAPPPAHDALDVLGRAGPPHREQPLFGLRRRHASEGPDLGVRQFSASKCAGQTRQRSEGARHPDLLPGCAPVESHAPAQPRGARAEAVGPAFAGVEYADEIEQASGGRVEVRRQKSDLVAEPVQLRDMFRSSADVRQIDVHREAPFYWDSKPRFRSHLRGVRSDDQTAARFSLSFGYVRDQRVREAPQSRHLMRTADLRPMLLNGAVKRNLRRRVSARRQPGDIGRADGQIAVGGSRPASTSTASSR